MMKTSILSILFLIVTVSILCFLGSWQIKRLQWKTELIQKIEIAYNQDPKKNELTYKKLTAQKPGEFSYGYVRGIYAYDQQIMLGPKTHNKKIGYHIVTPLLLDNGGTILVNRGWAPKKILEAKTSETISITGIARFPEYNPFTSKNSPNNDLWFQIDIDEISQAKNLKQILPVVLFADKADNSSGIIPVADHWIPRNNHLQYAIFWFTMAGIACVIYYLRFRRRKPKN